MMWLVAAHTSSRSLFEIQQSICVQVTGLRSGSWIFYELVCQTRQKEWCVHGWAWNTFINDKWLRLTVLRSWVNCVTWPFLNEATQPLMYIEYTENSIFISKYKVTKDQSWWKSIVLHTCGTSHKYRMTLIFLDFFLRFFFKFNLSFFGCFVF